MKRYSMILVVVLFSVGCSSRTAQVAVQEPHEHNPVNMLRPGNALGNSLTLHESYRGVGEETRRAALPSHSLDSSTARLAEPEMPFSSLPDGEWRSAETSATPEQVLGLERSLSGETSSSPVDQTSSSSLDLPSAPAMVLEPSSPSWSEIASSEPAPEPTGPISQVTTAQVYRAAESLPGLDTWAVVPFAHFQRDLRHVVVAWPALNSAGEAVDATVVGICLEESSNGALEQCGSRWVVNDRAAARAELERALGGSDYVVMSRQTSAPLSSLGPQLSQLGSAFTDAVSDGDRERAQQAAADFVQMLPADQIAFDNELAQLLWSAARYDGRLEHVSTEQGDLISTLTFDINRRWARIRTIQVLAEALDEDPNQWVVVDYR